MQDMDLSQAPDVFFL